MKLLQQEWMKNVLLPLSSRKMKTVGKFTASLTAKKQRESLHMRSLKHLNPLLTATFRV